MIKRLTSLFPLWAVLFSIWAYCSPALWAPLKPTIVPLLGLVMFGMGMTLTFADFRAVLRQPWIIALGVALQYLLMPLIAFGVSRLFTLPQELTIGMVLVGSAPGGTASNVICYLARADVALSITLTLVSTMISFLATPFLTWLYIHQVVSVPVLSMLISVLKIIVAPVLVGVGINTLWGTHLYKFKHIFPLISVFAIVVIIAIIVGLNKENIQQAGWLILVGVMLHNMVGLISGYSIARSLKLKEAQSRTIAIEVGMQNSGLAVALAVKYFSYLSALPGALFSIWHNLSGSVLARWWANRYG